MAGRPSDSANHAVRYLLTLLGERYDLEKGNPKFSKDHRRWAETIAHFEGKCCYCGREFEGEVIADHLIPISRKYLGLHAWGNLVPCHRSCNQKKHERSWEEHLETIASGADAPPPDDIEARRGKIRCLIAESGYRATSQSAIRDEVDRFYHKISQFTEDEAKRCSARLIAIIEANGNDDQSQQT